MCCLGMKNCIVIKLGLPCSLRTSIQDRVCIFIVYPFTKKSIPIVQIYLVYVEFVESWVNCSIEPQNIRYNL